MNQTQNTQLEHSYELYLGCLPKKVQHSQVTKYLMQFGSGIRVELAFKIKKKECRGHGRIFCTNFKAYKTLLSTDHYLGDRKIIIEQVKNPNELVAKYSHLQARKIKVTIPFPLRYAWNNTSFIRHFSSFGEIEMCHLKETPIEIKGQQFLVGNVTFTSKASIFTLRESEIVQNMDYFICEGTIHKQKLNSQKSRLNKPKKNITKNLNILNNSSHYIYRKNTIISDAYLKCYSPYHGASKNQQQNKKRAFPLEKMSDDQSRMKFYDFLRRKRVDINMNHCQSNILFR